MPLHQTVCYPGYSYLELEPIFGQVCSSDCVDKRWLNALFISYHELKLSSMNVFTFRCTVLAYSQAMQLMCNLAKQAVTDACAVFLEDSVVTAQILDVDLFGWRNQIGLAEFQLKSSADSQSLSRRHSHFGIFFHVI